MARIWYDDGDLICVDGCECWRGNCRPDQILFLKSSSPPLENTVVCNNLCTFNIITRPLGTFQFSVPELVAKYEVIERKMILRQDWKLFFEIRPCSQICPSDDQSLFQFSQKNQMIFNVKIITSEIRCQKSLKFTIFDDEAEIVIVVRKTLPERYSQIIVKQFQHDLVHIFAVFLDGAQIVKRPLTPFLCRF